MRSVHWALRHIRQNGLPSYSCPGRPTPGKTAEALDSPPVKLSLNHEEIGQTIGVTRQTVTRLLSEFKRREMLQLRKSNLCIQDRPALENISGLTFEVLL